MPTPFPSTPLACLAAVALLAAPLHAEAPSSEPQPSEIPPSEIPPVEAPPSEPVASEMGTVAFDQLADPLKLLRSAKWDAKRSAYVARVGKGRVAELTLDHELQEGLHKLLRQYAVPAAAVVALDPRTGKVLAVAEHSATDTPNGLAFQAAYPAASIFKIVTGAALLEAGVGGDTEVCFHGGKRRLELRNLRDDPQRDHRCETLTTAMGHSLNVVFAKLAARHLSADVLRSVAGRFLFNQPLPVFPPPPGLAASLVSPANIPEDDDELDFGRTAAGFGKVFLSPLHGALLAAAIGNGGVAFEPQLVQALDANGTRLAVPEPRPTRVVAPEVAGQLVEMLETTVSEGTARSAFVERRRAALPVRAAGKTGSLFDHQPFRDYSWFVGFAPAENPTVAVAAVVVNPRKWMVKAPYLAREAMRMHLAAEIRRARSAARQTQDASDREDPNGRR